MCLITDKKEVTKLEEDLTVYKVASQIDEITFQPYMYNTITYTKGKIFKDDVDGFRFELHYMDEYEQYDFKSGEFKTYKDIAYRINKGIHAFTNKKAIYKTTWLESVVVKCTIPKGSYVVFSRDEDDEIITNQIRIDEVVETNEKPIYNEQSSRYKQSLGIVPAPNESKLTESDESKKGFFQKIFG